MLFGIFFCEPFTLDLTVPPGGTSIQCGRGCAAGFAKVPPPGAPLINFNDGGEGGGV